MFVEFHNDFIFLGGLKFIAFEFDHKLIFFVDVAFAAFVYATESVDERILHVYGLYVKGHRIETGNSVWARSAGTDNVEHPV